MQVVKNDQTYKVKWRYENPTLQKLLSKKGITLSEFYKKPFEERKEILDGKAVPLPSVTVCEVEEKLEDGSYVVVAESVIKRYPNDPFDKEKARKISLARALQGKGITFSPDLVGRAAKAIRKSIWDSYLNRPKGVQKPQVVETH